jgi:glutaredoxin 3
VQRRVVVYTRPLCLFCGQVTDLLAEAGIPFDRHEASTIEEEQRLALQYGAAAYPIVVVDGAYLGGFTHIVKLHAEGRLVNLRVDSTVPPPPPSSTSSVRPPSSRPPSWTSQMGAVARRKPVK